jgi:hypothetical protein
MTKLSEAALAILGLTAFRDHDVVRAWKGMDWDLLDVLYQIPKVKRSRWFSQASVPGLPKISFNDILARNQQRALSNTVCSRRRPVRT